MRESKIEKALCNRVKALGGTCEKFKNPSRRGVPDRLITLPGGRIVFVELKAEGKEPNALQLKDHRERSALGCDVRVIDSLEAVNAFPS